MCFTLPFSRRPYRATPRGPTRIDIERLGSAVVLRITGQTMLGERWEDGLRYQFGRLIDGGERAFIIDITHYEMDDPFGGEILAAFGQAKTLGGSFSVIASPSQRQWFRTAKLDSVIPIVENDSQALSKSATDDSDRETCEDAG